MANTISAKVTFTEDRLCYSVEGVDGSIAYHYGMIGSEQELREDLEQFSLDFIIKARKVSDGTIRKT